MKKRYLIVFLFLIFCNINVVKANTEYIIPEDTYWIDREIYEETATNDSASWFDFISDLCLNNEYDCLLQCSSGSTPYDQYNSGNGCTDVNTSSNFSSDGVKNSARFTFGTFEYLKDDASNIEFYTFNFNATSFYNYLKGTTACEGATTCYNYISEIYCSSPNADSTMCEGIKDKIENDTTDGSCVYTWKPTRSSTTELDVNIAFEISIIDKNGEVVNDNDINKMENIKISIIKGYDSTYDINNNVLRYNGNILYFNGRESTYNDFKNEFIEKYKSSQQCPAIYLGNISYYNWYIEFDSSNFESERYDGVYVRYQKSYDGETLETGTISNTSTIQFGDKINFLNCEKLFEGEDSAKLLQLIQTIIKIVKIGVPIMLIGLGVVDFAKAIFSSSEDEMKKAQAKFIKRVIIGVCIFLIPTILKIILEIANSIWGNIDTDFCGIL